MEVEGADADRSTAGRACIPQQQQFTSVGDRMERSRSCTGTEQLKNLGSRLRVIGRRRLHARPVPSLNPPLTRVVATWVCCAGPTAASHCCLHLPSFLRLGFARLGLHSALYPPCRLLPANPRPSPAAPRNPVNPPQCHSTVNLTASL